MINMSDRNQVINKLKELQSKDLPKVSLDNFKKINNKFARDIEYATHDELEVIEKYLSKYHIDSKGNCIFTEEPPYLEWGLIHGAMYDSKTGLTWNAYHYLTIAGEERRYDTIMQYHPDCYGIYDED